MNITVVVIEWEKILFSEESIKEHCKESDYGLYQVYGYHPSYGDDSLLYIGRSVDQFFGRRVRKRYGFIESACIPTHVRLGRFVKSSNATVPLDWEIGRWDDLLCKAEKMLIKAHPPALNQKDNTGLLGDEFNKEPILLIHWGDFGKLTPETSSLRLSYRYWDYEDPISKSDVPPIVSP